MKILIVEDEKALSDSMVEYLGEEGHHCEATYNYFDALDKIGMYQYDCVVVDINLPDGNGLDLIRFIKKKSILVGIIIISALNSLENRIEGLEIGAD
ncbi:MAG TPA: response regulator, partial [Prolixibacteraceae bacterium]